MSWLHPMMSAAKATAMAAVMIIDRSKASVRPPFGCGAIERERQESYKEGSMFRVVEAAEMDA